MTHSNTTSTTINTINTSNTSLPAHLRSTLISRRQFRDGLKSHLFADAYFWSPENIRYKSVMYLLTYLPQTDVEPTTLRRVVSSAGESRPAGSKASGRTALRNICPGAGPAWYWLAAFAD